MLIICYKTTSNHKASHHCLNFETIKRNTRDKILITLKPYISNMSDISNPYEILKITPTATLKQITNAYKSILLNADPDSNISHIRAAYNTLINQPNSTKLNIESDIKIRKSSYRPTIQRPKIPSYFLEATPGVKKCENLKKAEKTFKAIQSKRKSQVETKKELIKNSNTIIPNNQKFSILQQKCVYSQAGYYRWNHGKVKQSRTPRHDGLQIHKVTNNMDQKMNKLQAVINNLKNDQK